MTTKLIVLACLLAVANARSIANYKVYFSKLSSRIIGGHDAKPGEFPYHVSLQLKFPELGLYDFTHICGGSILNNNWILTTANCLNIYQEGGKEYDVDLIVKAGKHNLNSTESSEQILAIDKVFIHEDFGLEIDVGPYDIGMIKLKDPLQLNKRVAPISLPKRDAKPTGLVTLSGWGAVQYLGIGSDEYDEYEMPSILQTMDLKIIGRDICNKAVNELQEEVIGHPLPHDLVYETNVCTAPLADGKGACSGDVGSPLISRDGNGKIELVGITSWGLRPCGLEGAPTVYTRTSAHIDWIENIMANN